MKMGSEGEFAGDTKEAIEILLTRVNVPVAALLATVDVVWLFPCVWICL